MDRCLVEIFDSSYNQYIDLRKLGRYLQSRVSIIDGKGEHFILHMTIRSFRKTNLLKELSKLPRFLNPPFLPFLQILLEPQKRTNSIRKLPLDNVSSSLAARSDRAFERFGSGQYALHETRYYLS